ncbi:MAG: IS66 family insertion sequence element accessory protein TnpB [Syntrophobacteraceae bacterium]
MIQITPQMRIFVCIEPVDFRMGIDGLCRLCRKVLGVDPFSGAVFIFRSKSKTALRTVNYDGQGFWMCHKRLSSGHFHQWPQNSQIDAFELQSLIWNFQPPQGAVKFFKKLS